MKRFARVGLLLVVAAVTGACAANSGARGAMPVADDAAPTSNDGTGNAARVAIAARIANAHDASALHHVCSSVAQASRMGCYSDGIIATMKVAGVTTAMAELDTLSNLDTAVKREGHMYAHALGLAAFNGPQNVGVTFRQCVPAFQSGCYHGVIQAYFADAIRSSGADSVSVDAINDLCKDYRGPADTWLLFQCVHGIGHGLEQVTHHALVRTLAGCDELRRWWEREGCYGGAFMENANEAFQPHHMVGRPEDMHDMGGMAGMSDMDMGDLPAPKLVDPADPLYPCSALADKYLNACYLMQTSVMLSLNHGDFADAAHSCDRVVESYRSMCYQSLGRDVSAYTLQDFGKAAALCTNGDALYQKWCHVGFVKNVIDIGADYRQGAQYCRTLSGVDNRKACYTAVGEQLAVLMPDTAKRNAACATVEAAFAETCKIAAGVRDQ